MENYAISETCSTTGHQGLLHCNCYPLWFFWMRIIRVRTEKHLHGFQSVAFHTAGYYSIKILLHRIFSGRKYIAFHYKPAKSFCECCLRCFYSPRKMILHISHKLENKNISVTIAIQFQISTTRIIKSRSKVNV